MSAAVVLMTAGAFAQLATDQVPHERTVPRSEEVRRDLEESRYHLGVFRLRPIFGIRDSGYDNNVFGGPSDEAVADWRSTVSVGAGLLLPVGSKMYVTGRVNPEYTYYHKLAERRLLGGQYGGSLLGLFNRLSLEAGGSTEKLIAPVSSELERSAPGTRRNVFARSELQLFQSISLFGSAQQQQQRYQLTQADLVQGVSLSQLERQETFVRGGVRYRLTSFLDFSVAGEDGRTMFFNAKKSDNNTRALLLGLHYDRPRFFLNLSGGRRSGTPRGPLSTFPSFSTATGSYYATYQFAAPLAAEAYGHRSVAYGLYEGNPYYFETRNGLGLTQPVGQRLGLRLFGEIGSNAYPRAAGAGMRRTDDVTTVGGGVAYRLYRKIVVSIIAADTRYRSNLPGYDRSVFRVATVISFLGASIR